MTTYTTADFKRWGKEGGDLHKEEPGYFSRISKMRKNPGRKKKVANHRYLITAITDEGETKTAKKSSESKEYITVKRKL